MNPSVAVIGTVFVDCKGFANETYHSSSRNLGTIQFVHGGVGRNVVENIARIGLNTTFVSSYDLNGVGKEVATRLQEIGVNVQYLQGVDEGGMGMWLAILDEQGDLAGSISQMPDLKHLAQVIKASGEELVQACTHLVLELDLNEAISRRVIALAKQHNKPVYGIPGNLDVVANHPDLLNTLECFICNHHEAGKLLGADLTLMQPQEMLPLLKKLVDSNTMRSMVITLGEQGCIFYDSATGESGHQPAELVRMIDSTGAGDAFFSGTVSGLVQGLSLSTAVLCGTKVAGWTIESAESTCPTLGDKVREDEFFRGFK
ncbi:PfkB family carbohydrate kinase [Paenibacillus sp. J2TS4]|uniref:PfkB family carbohydrate kinase n=1 Tax=Paenibacillus sp. J2TS4 TaxID=2807194 RepID=UPI001B1A1ADA|nr:PfkB family carbohydrate kinase [Paenibacillus sp. J2TS4]GIP35108.1 pseudouridine kinase [Paenibacillus sp. J2TS4]